MPADLLLTLHGELDEIARARPDLERFLERIGASRAGSHVAHLAFEEVVTNAVKYGYPDGRPGEVEVLLEVDGAWLTMHFRDHGIPFDPTSHPAPAIPATIRESRVGGLGLHLVRELAEEVAYRREGDTNHLQVRVRIAG